MKASDGDESQSQREAPFTAQLLLLKPISIQEYLLIAEDSIEMRSVDLKHLHRFSICSLPLDNMYFLMGAREVIEVNPKKTIYVNF